MTDTITERWLTDARIELQERVFTPRGIDLPESLRFRVGSIPGTRGTSRKVLGTYAPAAMCEDGVPQIYITPLRSDALTILATLAHECLHAVHPTAGHRGLFATDARAIGLAGKLTETVAGPDLATILESIAADLGAYPHGKLDPKARASQSTRMVKVWCPACRMPFRTARANFDKLHPYCQLHERWFVEPDAADNVAA